MLKAIIPTMIVMVSAVCFAQPPDLNSSNPYLRIGASRGMTTNELKSAYRKAVLQFHPDRVTDPILQAQYTENLKKINEAWEKIESEKRLREGASENTPRSKEDERLEKLMRAIEEFWGSKPENWEESVWEGIGWPENTPKGGLDVKTTLERARGLENPIPFLKETFHFYCTYSHKYVDTHGPRHYELFFELMSLPTNDRLGQLARKNLFPNFLLRSMQTREFVGDRRAPVSVQQAYEDFAKTLNWLGELVAGKYPNGNLARYQGLAEFILQFTDTSIEPRENLAHMLSDFLFRNWPDSVLNEAVSQLYAIKTQYPDSKAGKYAAQYLEAFFKEKNTTEHDYMKARGLAANCTLLLTER